MSHILNREGALRLSIPIRELAAKKARNALSLIGLEHLYPASFTQTSSYLLHRLFYFHSFYSGIALNDLDTRSQTFRASTLMSPQSLVPASVMVGSSNSSTTSSTRTATRGTATATLYLSRRTMTTASATSATTTTTTTTAPRMSTEATAAATTVSSSSSSQSSTATSAV